MGSVSERFFSIRFRYPRKIKTVRTKITPPTTPPTMAAVLCVEALVLEVDVDVDDDSGKEGTGNDGFEANVAKEGLYVM